MSRPLARILQAQGFGTRRAATQLVRAGRVAVDGVIVTDPDTEFDCAGRTLTVDGIDWPCLERATLVLNKPAGYECSRAPRHHPSVYRLLPEPLFQRGVECVGRLDQDTTGLLIFTDEGSLHHRLISPRHHVPKVYRVTCAEPVTPAQLARLTGGVVLNDSPEPVRARVAEPLDETCLRLVIAEGRYHQVKRMLAAAGNHVVALHREAVGGFTLPEDLPVGAWRILDAAACQALTDTGSTQTA